MGSIVFWSFGLIGLLVLMAFAIAWLRKRLSATEPDSPAGFTLGELRELHRRGAMTDAEFEVAKNLVIKGIKTSDKPRNPGASSTDKGKIT